MKMKYPIMIFAPVIIAFFFLKYVNINEMFKKIEETNMEKCKRFEMDKCIISQIQYRNFTILSTCYKCNCNKYGAQFLYVNLTSSQMNPVILQNVNVKSGFYGSTMSINKNRLFVVNELNNTIAGFDIELLQGFLSLYFKFEIKEQKEFKIGWIYALSEYELLATEYNNTSSGNLLINFFSNMISPRNQSSIIQYFVYNPRTNQINSQLVDGIEDDMPTLTGIVQTKHNKFIVGSPDEKSIRVYQYFWFQGIAMKFTKLNTTFVGFEVGEIIYDKEEDQILIAEYSKTFPSYVCWGSLYAIKGNQDKDYNKMTQELAFSTKKNICSMSSAINYEGIYYIGTKFATEYLVCLK